jgi:uncharacterized protein
MNIKINIAPQETAEDYLGLFALESIEEDTIVWEGNDNNFVEVTGYSYELLDPMGRSFIDMYCSHITDDWYCRMDDSRFINHSDTPNLRFDMSTKTMVALRDIDEGEELTLDYRTFDNSFTGQS